MSIKSKPFPEKGAAFLLGGFYVRYLKEKRKGVF